MKKIMFTLMLALICSVASFAQTMTVTHNVKDTHGRNCMKLTCNYALNQGGQVSLLAIFLDANGDPLQTNDENFDDGEGNLCCYGGPFTVQANRNYTCDMYMPYNVIGQSTTPGATNYVYFALLDEDNDGEEIVESEPVSFYVR
ncbi:MAG: hypothetical protein MJZ66_04040 [Bacteroidales bacterium]|nr:hypothetical protein [Bacteroidales bacterium]